MFCKKYADRGVLYLYNELETGAKHDFEAHLESCHKCQAELALLKESKMFTSMLLLEKISPVVLEETIPSYNTGRYEKYVNLLKSLFRSIFPGGRRLVLVPAGALFLFILMFYLFNPEFNIFRSSVSHYDEYIFDWDVGLEESIADMDQRITQLKSENLFMELDSLNSDFSYASIDDYSDQIEADVQSLSSELASFNF